MASLKAFVNGSLRMTTLCLMIQPIIIKEAIANGHQRTMRILIVWLLLFKPKEPKTEEKPKPKQELELDWPKEMKTATKGQCNIWPQEQPAAWEGTAKLERILIPLPKPAPMWLPSLNPGLLQQSSLFQTQAGPTTLSIQKKEPFAENVESQLQTTIPAHSTPANDLQLSL